MVPAPAGRGGRTYPTPAGRVASAPARAYRDLARVERESDQVSIRLPRSGVPCHRMSEALEEVFIQAIERCGLLDLHAHAVGDEQVCELCAVDQLDPSIDPIGFFASSGGES